MIYQETAIDYCFIPMLCLGKDVGTPDASGDAGQLYILSVLVHYAAVAKEQIVRLSRVMQRKDRRITSKPDGQ